MTDNMLSINVFDLGTYLVIGLGIVGAIIYSQWKWTKTCKNFVLVLIKKADGHGAYELAPQAGGSVSLRASADSKDNTIRMWPLNELATIDVPYPGVGFVPMFMQKQIRMVIVDEQDWEPLTNRSPHRPRVASPDVVAVLTCIAEDTKDENVKSQIKDLLDGVATGPSRELIASPALLGNTVMERVSEVAITVVKDVMDPITSVIKRLNKLVTPNMYYIGTAVTIVALIVLIYLVFSLQTDISLLLPPVDMPTP